MQVVFGRIVADKLRERFIVLELDTIKFQGANEPIECFCVIDAGQVALGDLPTIENYITMHNELVRSYKMRNWNYCEQAIEALLRKWGGELDSFYLSMSQRITEFKDNAPADDWTGVLESKKEEA